MHIFNCGYGVLKRYSHVNWAITDQTMVSACNFLTAVLLARFLGIEEFGRFTLVWLIVEFLHSIQHALIIAPMMSVGSKQSGDEIASYLGAMLVQQISVAAIMFALVILGGHIANSLFPIWKIEGIAIALSFAVFTYQMQNFLRRYLFIRGRAPLAFVCDVIRYPGQVAIVLWFARQEGFDTSAVLWIIAGSGAAAALVGFCFIERPTLDPTKLVSIVSRHWHLAKWLTSSAILRWSTDGMFMIVLGSLIGPAAVGGIRAAQSLLGLVHIISLAVENVAPSRAARYLSQQGPAAMAAYLRRVGWVMGSAALAILALVAISPEFWLTLLYGSEFGGQGYLVRWFALNYFCGFLTFPPRFGLRAMEQGRGIFVTNLSTAGFSVLFCYPLVAWLGVSGAMLGFSVVIALQLAILRVAFDRCLRRLMGRP